MDTDAFCEAQREQIMFQLKIAVREWVHESGATFEDGRKIIVGGKDLQNAVKVKLAELARGRYASEVIPSTYTYPPEFTGLMSVRDQVEALMKHFPHLDPTWALDHGQAWYDSLKPELPDWIEGPLVYIWHEDIYHNALQLVLDKLATTRKFCNHQSGQLDQSHLKQTELTKTMERKLHAIQPGGFLIVPSQLGVRYRGSSVCRDRELFIPGEFGHGSLAVSCMALTHPTRFVGWEQLQADCAGDEFAPGGDGLFDLVPDFNFDNGGFEFSARGIGCPNDDYGTVSAFLPQKLFDVFTGI